MAYKKCDGACEQACGTGPGCETKIAEPEGYHRATGYCQRIDGEYYAEHQFRQPEIILEYECGRRDITEKDAVG